MPVKATTAEQMIARIAGRNHGVVTRRQLLAAGVTRSEIEHRVRVGGLIAVYRGVYRVGHAAPSTDSLYLAAVYACGDGGALIGRAAAHQHGLVKGRPPPPEVTARGKRRVRGVRTRRVKLARDEVTRVRGIPVTTVARTLVDLAAVLPADELARACHEAGVRYRTTPGQLEAILAGRPSAPGARTLRRVMSGDEPVTLSHLVTAFIALLRVHDLPVPKTNERIDDHRVDCRWPDLDPPLTVELDSYRFHNSRHSWEQDRARERAARRRGEQPPRRYTWHDVVEEPAPTARELRVLLEPARARSARPAARRRGA